MSIQEWVNELIVQSKKASPEQLSQLIERAGAAPFAGDLLEADEALWGSFWQGDVIAPGYLLPAAELALLRATRLDQTWPEETSVAVFLADLHEAIRHPQAGVWTLRVAGEPCVIFAAPRVEGLTFSVKRSTFNAATVVWYCATTDHLHAGYWLIVDSLNFPGAEEQRSSDLEALPLNLVCTPRWLEVTVEQHQTGGGRWSAVSGSSLAARLDAEILRIRLQGYSTRPSTE